VIDVDGRWQVGDGKLPHVCQQAFILLGSILFILTSERWYRDLTILEVLRQSEKMNVYNGLSAFRIFLCNV
jgi:hypothetical protein